LKYGVVIHDRVHEVEIVEEGGCRRILWDGKPVDVDCPLERANPLNSMIIDGRPYEIEWRGGGKTVWVSLDNAMYEVLVNRGFVGREKAAFLSRGSGQETVQAPMPGMVVALRVEPNQEVKIGEPLLILEAMKMENELRSPVDGRVHEVCVVTGKKVEKGEKLLVLRT